MVRTGCITCGLVLVLQHMSELCWMIGTENGRDWENVCGEEVARRAPKVNRKISPAIAPADTIPEARKPHHHDAREVRQLYL